MARKPSFSFRKTESGWQVEIPSRLSTTGKRQRAFFTTRDKAKEYAAGLREKYHADGINASAIKPSLAEDATIASEMLAPLGISLVEAARMVVAQRTAELASKKMENALTEFQISKEGRSGAHAKAYGYMCRDLNASFAGRFLSSISSKELLHHAEKFGRTPSTFNALARLLGAFWRWCARHPRDWCEAKLIDVLERKETRRREIGVLDSRQCERLLRTAEEHYPDCVAPFAIALFTGMRSAELGRLAADDVSKHGINLPAASTKTGQRRFIEMPAELTAWLNAYPLTGTVLPGSWSKKEKAVRRLAGWKVWSDLVEPHSPPDDLPEWPHNALRHTHASVLVALNKPLEMLIFEFGHSGGVQTLKSHYLGVMSKAEARKILHLKPKDGA